MKKLTGTMLILSMVALTACNTAVGAAKDVYGGGKYVVKKAVGSDDKKTQ